MQVGLIGIPTRLGASCTVPLGKSETPLLQMLSPKMICGAARSRAVLFLATSNFYIPEGYEDTARHLAYSSRGAQASARTGWG